jgi:hypothetical protein
MIPPSVLVPAESIDDVIARLDEVVARSVRDNSCVGLFACLYRSVTARVRDGIREGHFEDGARMERFDVVFANRYLTALETYSRGEHPGRSWMAAFEGTRSRRLLLLQHLLLGMNAHINFDLGIAAAQTAPGDSLRGLRNDFLSISALLGEMLDGVQDRITRVSPWMGIVDRVGCRTDEHAFFFALSRARDCAWRVAQCLATASPARMPLELDRVDRAAAHLGRRIRRPGAHLLPALLLVRSRETAEIGAVLEALA